MRYHEIVAAPLGEAVLTELFNTTKLTWVTRTDREHVAEVAVSAHVKYSFRFQRKALSLWMYDFALMRTDDGDWWQADQGIVPGYGNPFEVMGSAMQALKEFAASQQPQTVCFLATKNESSRVRLYRRLFCDGGIGVPAGYDFSEQDDGRMIIFKFDRQR
jgi:hypothetical protein